MNMQELTRRSEDVADLLKVMSNSHRLLILCELNNGERSVSALEEIVGLSQSALSQHLAKLREAASSKRAGTRKRSIIRSSIPGSWDWSGRSTIYFACPSPRRQGCENRNGNRLSTFVVWGTVAAPRCAKRDITLPPTSGIRRGAARRACTVMVIALRERLR